MGLIYRSNNPTEFDDVDGIIVNETAPAPRIEGVAANIAILVGQFQRGPVNELIEVSSIGELHEIYGKSDFSGNFELKNKRFGRLRIIRVLPGSAAKATVTLDDVTPADSIVLTAKYYGAYGNSLQYKVENGTTSGKKYTFRDNNSGSVLPDEVYDNVSAIGKTAQQLLEIFGNSKIMDVTPPGSPAVAEPVNVSTFTALTSGAAGTAVAGDYEDAIAVAEQEGAGNVLWCDQYSDAIRLALKAHLLLAPDKIVVMANDSVNDDQSAAETEVALNRDSEGAIIYAFNPIETVINGVKQWTSPAAWVASIISNTSPHIDPAYSANVRWTTGGLRVKYPMTRANLISAKEKGIAAFEDVQNLGIKLRSGVVTQIVNSSKQTILRRRMAYFYPDSIARFLVNYQNAPNTQANRTLVKGGIVAFDDGLIQDGIVPSDAEVLDGKARLIDTEVLNTNDSIAAGFFKILIKRRIYSSMRFIVLQVEIGESVVVTEGE